MSRNFDCMYCSFKIRNTKHFKYKGLRGVIAALERLYDHIKSSHPEKHDNLYPIEQK